MTQARNPDGRTSIALTIYLLKEGPQDEQAFISQHGHQAPVVLGNTPRGRIFVQGRPPSPPPWVGFFEGAADLSPFGLLTASNAGVWILSVGGRFFALTFGQGRFLLADDVYEERFGLKVTLNCVEGGKLRSLDHKTFDAVARQVRKQADIDAKSSEFGLDIERDLLSAATGTPADPRYGRKMTGADALHVTLRTRLDEVPELLQLYLDKYHDTSYREHFPWVDTISPVKDKATIRALEDELVATLATGQHDNIRLTLPGIIDWADTAGFHYGGRNPPTIDDLRLPDLVEALGDGPITMDLLRQKKVYRVSTIEGAARNHWTAYKCLYAEVIRDGEVYLLNEGAWFRVERNFVDVVYGYFSTIPQPDLLLPDCTQKDEATYNESIVGSGLGAWHLLDAKNIPYGGGQSKIEFCDLHSESKELLFVKRYSRSSTLSHWFAQGLVSGELLNSDAEFRAAVQPRLPPEIRFANPAERIRPEDYKLIYVLIDSRDGPIKLPFFSLVMLRQAHKRLTGFGYYVGLQKVKKLGPVEPTDGEEEAA